MERIFLIAEAVKNNLQILTDEQTGFAVVFDSCNIAYEVAEETCDFPFQILEVKIGSGSLWER